MKQTQKVLMTLCVGILILTIIFVALYETDMLETGTWAGLEQAEFLTTTVMELLTLAAAFVGLRMFKFRKVHEQLVGQKAPALLKFGVLRLLTLEAPMFFNTLFYYKYMNPTFGYLAIILLLCLPFVWPTMSRCIAETTEEAS